MRLANITARAMVDAAVDQLNVAGTLEIWEAVAGANPPAEAETAITDNDTDYKLLATKTLATNLFGAAADTNPNARATVTTVPITIDGSTDVAKSGTAEFYRVKNNGGTVVWQGTCGTSATDMILSSTTVATGTDISITAWTFTLLEA